MITFEVDEPKSLLVIRYRGHVAAEETEKGLYDVRAGLAKLNSGFRLLADLTELEKMDVACAPFIEQAMDLCNQKRCIDGGASYSRSASRHWSADHVDVSLQWRCSHHYLPESG